MFNSGMGDMSMAGATPQSLEGLCGAVLYVVVATENAQLDYERIDHTPVSFANMLDGNHGGTFNEKFGGAFARMALNWLDWQFKEDKEKASVFLNRDVSSFPGWTIDSKNLEK